MEIPFDHYSLAREAQACGQALLVDSPIGKQFAPTQALRQLTDPKPTYLPTLDHPLTFSLKCQLALLWSRLGYHDQASTLASQLKPLIEKGYLALWTEEKEYDERESFLSAALLMRALGFHEMSCPEEGFFAYLYNMDLKIETVEIPHSELIVGQDSSMFLSDSVQAGAFQIGNVFVPAFGPQLAPLSNADSFGICAAQNGWFCAKGSKDSWFKIDHVSSCSFDLQSISNISVPFAFYVKAEECIIEGRIFKPKSLQRLNSKATTVQFKQNGKIVELGFDVPLAIELIPLAGENSFWGASFLLAFYIPASSGKLRFTSHCL